MAVHASARAAPPATSSTAAPGYGNGHYDLTLVGPNRFLRRFAGNATKPGKDAEVTSSYATAPGTGKLAIYFHLTNSDGRR